MMDFKSNINLINAHDFIKQLAMNLWSLFKGFYKSI